MDRLVEQAAEHELDPGGRRRIEPLEVVDREDELLLFGKYADEGQERGSEQPPLGRPVCLGAEQSDLQRPALHGRYGVEHLGRHGRKQVGEPCEGELRLRLRRPRHEHRHAAGAGTGDRLFPDRRLADPRLSDDREDRVGARALVEELLDRLELGLTPDDARHTERVSGLPYGRVKPPRR